MFLERESYDHRSLQPQFFLPNLIAITSLSGAGSSTILGLLRKNFGDGWRYLSGGDTQRLFAQELGVSMEELAGSNRRQPGSGSDKRCDELLVRFALDDRGVMEARLAHVMAPRAFKVHLKCSEKVRARRRFLNQPNDRPRLSFEEVQALIRQRDEDDSKRYDVLYPGWRWSLGEFDLVLDTGVLTPDQTLEEILRAHASWVAEKRAQGLILS